MSTSDERHENLLEWFSFSFMSAFLFCFVFWNKVVQAQNLLQVKSPKQTQCKRAQICYFDERVHPTGPIKLMLFSTTHIYIYIYIYENKFNKECKNVTLTPANNIMLTQIFTNTNLGHV